MLRAYNKFGEPIEPPEFIELQWNRKFYDFGNFSLYMPLELYNSDIKYLQLENRPETGIIQKTFYERQNGIDYVTLSGFFVDKLLDFGVVTKSSEFKVEGSKNESIFYQLWLSMSQYTDWIWDKIKAKNLPADQMEQINNMLMSEKHTSPNLYCTEFSNDFEFPKGLYYLANPGEHIGQILKKIYEPYKISVNASPVFNPHGREKDNIEPIIGLELKTRKAIDKSEQVYFGDAFENIKHLQYSFDDSGVYASYVIRQEVPDEARFPSRIVDYDYQRGKKSYWIFEKYVSNTNIPYDIGLSFPEQLLTTELDAFNNDLSEKQIKEKMVKAAILDMLDHYKIETFTADVLQNTFYYLKDYDLGDYCTIIASKLGNVPYKTQIVEVRERIVHNKNEIEIVFGTPQKEKYRKVVI